MVKRTTLKDVASYVGVSVTTASLVLNGRPARVSQEKRDAIFEAARVLHYVPNQNARSLVTKKSMLIALIVPDIENLFFASLSKQIEDVCAAEGYSLIVANSDDSRERERKLINILASREVDGMFLIMARESHEKPLELQSDIENVPCPVVLVDRLFTQEWCDGVGFDNYFGGQLAARCLLDAGHTRIGCVTGDTNEENAHARLRGFIDTIHEAGLEFDPSLRVEGDYRFRGGYEAADVMIDGGATAVFCCNDLMGAGFMQRCVERGISVPKDISMIGYDDILERFGLFGSVTTIEQDATLLAHSSWNMLRTHIDGTAKERTKERTKERAKVAVKEAAKESMQVRLNEASAASDESTREMQAEQSVQVGQAEQSPAQDAVDTLEVDAVAAQSHEAATASNATAEASDHTDKPWIMFPRTQMLAPRLIKRSTVADI